MTGARYTYRRYIDDSFADRMRDKPAADRWCVHALLRSGHIVASHHGAAVRLSKLIERGNGQCGSGNSEKVDGGNADPHARQWDAALCAQEAECAFAAVATSIAPRARHPEALAMKRKRSLAAFHAAVSFPHLTTAEAARDAGIGYGRTRDFCEALVPALEALVTYFDAVDAQMAREAKRG